MGNTDIEDSLQRLDQLTREEAQMAFVELLKVTHGVDNKVTAVDVKVMGVDDKVDGVGREIQEVHDDVQDVGNKVQGVEGRVQAIHGNVQYVSTKIQGVDSRVQGIGSDIKEISNEVQGVDEKLDQVNRASSLLPVCYSETSDSFTGRLLRDKLLQWLSPPDPSINHNIACKNAPRNDVRLRRRKRNRWQRLAEVPGLESERAPRRLGSVVANSSFDLSRESFSTGLG